MSRTLLSAAALLFASCAAVPVAALETAPPPSGAFRATGFPDRIVLSAAADPARGMGVAFRTDPRQAEALAEIAPARDGPSLAAGAATIRGESTRLETENGAAIHHRVRFAGLEPDTAYAYRVRGADGWSEWLHFRTAAAEARPFTFLYFGDTQNRILEVGARVIRQAFLDTAAPALAVHAGDLVAQRAEKAHDEEWAEWAAAGGFAFASVPQLPAPGNHEYVDAVAPDGSETRRLGPHWPASFALPANGAPGAEATSYFVDYQGVRFVILDGTAALDLGAMETQSRWLDAVLPRGGDRRWTIALMHQPVFTCARPNDIQRIKAAWQPLFERHGVDLVLQGHDHCYGRWTREAGRDASARAVAAGEAQGPVYMVSVTGAKMYALNDRAETQPDHAAEETQLYQQVEVGEDRITVTSRTATGRLYDRFAIARQADGTNRLVEEGADAIPARRCRDGMGPDGTPCTAEVKD